MVTFDLAYTVRVRQRPAHLGMFHHSTMAIIAACTVGHFAFTGENRKSRTDDVAKKGRDLADLTCKVKRQRTVCYIHVHPVQARGEGVGFINKGNKGQLCFYNCSTGCFLERCWLFLFKLAALETDCLQGNMRQSRSCCVEFNRLTQS